MSTTVRITRYDGPIRYVTLFDDPPVSEEQVAAVRANLEHLYSAYELLTRPDRARGGTHMSAARYATWRDRIAEYRCARHDGCARGVALWRARGLWMVSA